MADENPFQPPAAHVSDPVDVTGDLLMEPRKAPAGHGWEWIRDGFALFGRAPLIWIVNILIFFTISVLLARVPVVSLLSAPLSLIFAGGLMLGCKELQQGERLTVQHLFAGFKVNTGALIALGGLYLGANLLIMFVLGLIFWQGIGGFAGLEMLMQTGEMPMSAADMQSAILLLLMLLSLGLLLLMPVVMAVWFAPALIVLHDLNAIEAAKLSFRACLKNWLPFLVYGLIATALLLVALVPVGLGLLVVVPALTASVYAGYRDIFLRQV